jgi:chemotaxis protein methyltransferase CheR
MQTEVILPFFAKYIESELGIIYAEHNYFQLQNRLEDIAKLLGVNCIKKLYDQSQGEINGQFKQLLLDVATNNETSFFRDPKVFKAIENVLLSDSERSARGVRPLRIWSAASSTGQEALSIAIMLKEWSLAHSTEIHFSITGTDISERVLARAQAAQYTQLEIQRGLPAAYLVKYFTKDLNDRWTANSDLTRNIRFQKLNLLDPFQFGSSFDLILCRNVLIYQSVKSKIEVLNRMSRVLLPGGYLALGSGESLLGLSQSFTQVNSDGAVLYRNPLSS